jgi:hypothetical protein
MSTEYNEKPVIWPLILITIVVLGCTIWWCHRCIHERNLQNDPMLWKLKEILEPLHPEIKNLKLYKGDQSYTINKKKIFLCLKDKNGDYYNTNMLIYVLLHEFSHYLNTEDVGHTPTFHKIFENLLEKANDMGIYDSSIPLVKNYCGYSE